jgi:hypothetical protein
MVDDGEEESRGRNALPISIVALSGGWSNRYENTSFVFAIVCASSRRCEMRIRICVNPKRPGSTTHACMHAEITTDRQAALVLEATRQDPVASAVRAADQRVVRVVLKQLRDSIVGEARVLRGERCHELAIVVNASRAERSALVRVLCAVSARDVTGSQ